MNLIQTFGRIKKKKFNLTVSSNRNKVTIKYGSTNDAIFSKFLAEIKSPTFMSYFSYHKQIVSFVKSPYIYLLNNNNNIIIIIFILTLHNKLLRIC